VMRSESNFQTWWNGCLRCSTYFHNIIGLLAEIKGNPTPRIEIAFLPKKHLSYNDYPYPIAPQKWHFRQSIEYSITADRAVIDVASKYREDFLFNIYRMGKNSIERGKRDHWTITPKRVDAVLTAIEGDNAQLIGFGRSRGYSREYYKMLRDLSSRDPRGYILPSDQSDFLTAYKFINALIKSGISVHRATQAFEVRGKSYPQGSLVVKTAQAFRPYILDMFEPQDYPNDIPCPGGTPIAPYDNAGWTLAFQMGVKFDRILDEFDGPFERIEGLARPPDGKVTNSDAAGFILSHRINDSFTAINRLLKNDDEVYWLKDPFQVGEKIFPAVTVGLLLIIAALTIPLPSASSISYVKRRAQEQ